MIIALNPQPVLDETGMWQWKDCQWLESGIGFPESGIEDHAPYKPGEVFEDEGKRKRVLDVRVKKNTIPYRAHRARGCGLSLQKT